MSNNQSNSNALTPVLSSKIEKVLLQEDLSVLTDDERLNYYKCVCESVGLNPLTQPFSYLELNRKLVLYANKGCADQLRAIHRISIEIVSREKIGEVYVVTARAKGLDGRTDESTGAVALGKSYGDTLANLYMKAETKAKRRVTLSIVGLGMLDETEVETIPNTNKVEESKKPVAKFTNHDIDEDLIDAAAQMARRGARPGHKVDAPIEVQKPNVEPINDSKEDILKPVHPGDVSIQFGKKYLGRRFKEFTKEQIQGYVDWLKGSDKPMSAAAEKFVKDADAYLMSEMDIAF